MDRLNAELLAPGTRAGGLTVWTESSLEKLAERLPESKPMIIKSPYVTEKVTSMIDSNDTLEFLVNINATKPEIKKAWRIFMISMSWQSGP